MARAKLDKEEMEQKAREEYQQVIDSQEAESNSRNSRARTCSVPKKPHNFVIGSSGSFKLPWCRTA